MLVTASLVAGLVVGAIAAVLVLRSWSGSAVASAARRREELLAETDRQVEAREREAQIEAREHERVPDLAEADRERHRIGIPGPKVRALHTRPAEPVGR